MVIIWLWNKLQGLFYPSREVATAVTIPHPTRPQVSSHRCAYDARAIKRRMVTDLVNGRGSELVLVVKEMENVD